MDSRHWILMGDIVGSGQSQRVYGIPPDRLSVELNNLIQRLNRELSNRILSPYAVTLGDEFQGLALSLVDAVQTLFFLKEEKLRQGYTWKLRYVLHEGIIQSEINREIAYGMIGPGLALARKMLSMKGRRNRPRFQILIQDSTLAKKLWNPEDGEYHWTMIQQRNDQRVAEALGKRRSSVWKKRQRDLILEYLQMKELVFLEINSGEENE